MEKRQFFGLLEGMRGVAAALIILRHIPNYIKPLDFPRSGLAVDLFFVLSGVVIANAYETRLLSGKMSLAEFSLRRLIRIYPLYLVASAIGLIAVLIENSVQYNQIGLMIFLGFLMLPFPYKGIPIYPLDLPAWSLFFEFIANFVYARMIKFLSSRNILFIIILSWLVLISFSATTRIPLDLTGFTRVTFVVGIPRVFATFFTGVLIFRFANRNRGEFSLGNGGAVCLIAGVVALLLMPIGWPWAWIYCLITASIALPLLVYLALFTYPSGRLGKIVLLLGELSFPAYVIHAPLYMLSDVLWGHQIEPYAPYSGMLFLACVVALAIIVNRHVDAPMRKLVTGQFFK